MTFKAKHAKFVQTGILPNSNNVNTIIWLHHMDANEMLRKKAR